jgi:hypothetical protein
LIIFAFFFGFVLFFPFPLNEIFKLGLPNVVPSFVAGYHMTMVGGSTGQMLECHTVCALRHFTSVQQGADSSITHPLACNSICTKQAEFSTSKKAAAQIWDIAVVYEDNVQRYQLLTHYS